MPALTRTRTSLCELRARVRADLAGLGRLRGGRRAPSPGPHASEAQDGSRGDAAALAPADRCSREMAVVCRQWLFQLPRSANQLPGARGIPGARSRDAGGESSPAAIAAELARGAAARPLIWATRYRATSSRTSGVADGVVVGIVTNNCVPTLPQAKEEFQKGWALFAAGVRKGGGRVKRRRPQVRFPLSTGRSPGAFINAIREVLHAEMMRVEVGGTQQPRCWRGAYEKRIGYQCG